MTVTIETIITEARDIADLGSASVAVTDDQLTRWANEGQREAMAIVARSNPGVATTTTAFTLTTTNYYSLLTLPMAVRGVSRVINGVYWPIRQGGPHDGATGERRWRYTLSAGSGRIEILPATGAAGTYAVHTVEAPIDMFSLTEDLNTVLEGLGAAPFVFYYAARKALIRCERPQEAVNRAERLLAEAKESLEESARMFTAHDPVEKETVDDCWNLTSSNAPFGRW